MTVRVALAAALMVVAGCAGGLTARGVVLDVQGPLGAVEAFTIRTTDGRELRFEPHPDARFEDFPLDHLRQHRIVGDPVLVGYVEEGGRLLAVEIADG